MADLDHVVVTAATLEEGVRFVEACLGVPMGAGGVHSGLGTHNRLLSLGPETYLEVIAPNPGDSSPKSARMFDLDSFSGPPRLSNWVISSKSISHIIKKAPFGIGKIRDLRRGKFRWRMSVPESGNLPFDGAFPALIEWQTPSPAPLLSDVGVRLLDFEIYHPENSLLKGAIDTFIVDPRIKVHQGQAFSMCLKIDTPNGKRVLR